MKNNGMKKLLALVLALLLGLRRPLLPGHERMS